MRLISPRRFFLIWAVVTLCVPKVGLCDDLAGAANSGNASKANLLPKSENAKARQERDRSSQDEPDEPKSVKVKIPERLRGDRFKLLIDGEQVNLGQGEMSLKPTLEQISIELYDRRGRLVDHRAEFLDEDVLEQTRERSLRIALQLGSSHSPNPGPWKSIFLSGNRVLLSGEVGYFWGAIGTTGFVSYQNETASRTEGFLASYTEVQVGTFLSYEIAPFNFAVSYWKKVMVSPLLGIFYSSQSVVLTDDEIEKTDRAGGVGIMMGGESRFPVMNNFFLMGRYFVQYQSIILSEVGLRTKLPQHNFIIGGGYVL